MRTASAWAIKDPRTNLYYTHGYPSGEWREFPRIQLYQSYGAATRQANKLSNVEVVEIELSVKQTDS